MKKRLRRILLMMMAVTYVAMLSSCHKDVNTTDFRYRDHRQNRERTHEHSRNKGKHDKGKDDKNVADTGLRRCFRVRPTVGDPTGTHCAREKS